MDTERLFLYLRLIVIILICLIVIIKKKLLDKPLIFFPIAFIAGFLTWVCLQSALNSIDFLDFHEIAIIFQIYIPFVVLPLLLRALPVIVLIALGIIAIRRINALEKKNKQQEADKQEENEL
jgi:predicted membrane protein